MSRFLFSTQNADGTTNLYATDGTAAGTTDLDMSRFGFTLAPLPGAEFVGFGGRLFFVGSDSAAGKAESVYSTNGTAAGTVSVSVGGSVVPDGLWVLGGTLLFSGLTGTGASGLWASTDGASFKEIGSGVEASDLVISQRIGYFSALGPNGTNAGLWRTDGTAAGTASIAPAGQVLDPLAILSLGNGKAVFANEAADGTVSLWVTDGTAAGTHRIVNAALGSNIGQDISGASVNGKVFFNAIDSRGQISAWATDGASAGTVELHVNGPSGAAIRTPGGFVAWNNKMLFSTGYGLMVSDGTAAGTVFLSQPAPNTWIADGKTILFSQIDPNGASAPDGSAAIALFVSDGTAAGTHVLRVPGLGSLGETPLSLVDGKVVFSAYDSAGRESFFSTDGTVAGTRELALPAGVVLDPNNPPAVAALPAGITTLAGGTQVYVAPSGAIVQAGDGNDTVSAAAGNVSVTGGSGRLTFFGGTAASSVSGGAGSATIHGGAGGGVFTGGSAGHNVLISQTLAGHGNTTLTGAAAGDQLFASAGGNDVLVAAGGRETLIAGGGHDTITGGGTAGSVIFGSTGAATVTGGVAGGDSIIGGSGTLLIEAQKGDAIFAGSGATSVNGSAQGSADVISGSSGALSVTGHGGNMLVVGGTGASNINTGNGADVVYGGGAMTVTTGSGFSEIVIQSGTLTVSEGSGATVYDVVEGASAKATASITGFRPGTDRIDLFGFQTSGVTVASSGGQTTIHLSNGAQINLVGLAHLGSGLSFG